MFKIDFYGWQFYPMVKIYLFELDFYGWQFYLF